MWQKVDTRERKEQSQESRQTQRNTRGRQKGDVRETRRRQRETKGDKRETKGDKKGGKTETKGKQRETKEIKVIQRETIGLLTVARGRDHGKKRTFAGSHEKRKGTQEGNKRETRERTD